MFKIAICDDEQAINSQIEKIILKHAQETYLQVDVEVFTSGEELCDYIIKKGHKFDLIYLDIELGLMNGIDVGKKIRKVMMDQKTEIVFISGKDQYDRQLFDVQPLHFIPKPIDAKIVIEDLYLAMSRVNKFGGDFTYKKGFEIIKVPIQDIIYFESLNRQIKIVTVNGEDLFYGIIDNIFIFVAQYRFLKTHRSYLINYLHIVSFKYDEVIMSNQERLPISQSRRKEIRNIQLNLE